MRDAKRKLLRIAALGVVLISLAIQIMVIGDLWWDFDPRRSCDRLLYWDEWIACLHGTSHMYILSAEVAAMTWLIAGVAVPVGRFSPPYISVIVPGGVVVGFIWWLVGYWDESVTPYEPFGEPTLWHVVAFAIRTSIVAPYLVRPVAGAWLWALHARIGHGPEHDPEKWVRVFGKDNADAKKRRKSYASSIGISVIHRARAAAGLGAIRQLPDRRSDD